MSMIVGKMEEIMSGLKQRSVKLMLRTNSRKWKMWYGKCNSGE